MFRCRNASISGTSVFIIFFPPLPVLSFGKFHFPQQIHLLVFRPLRRQQGEIPASVVAASSVAQSSR